MIVTIPIFIKTILYCNKVVIDLPSITGFPNIEYVNLDKKSEGPGLIFKL